MLYLFLFARKACKFHLYDASSYQCETSYPAVYNIYNSSKIFIIAFIELKQKLYSVKFNDDIFFIFLMTYYCTESYAIYKGNYR